MAIGIVRAYALSRPGHIRRAADAVPPPVRRLIVIPITEVICNFTIPCNIMLMEKLEN